MTILKAQVKHRFLVSSAHIGSFSTGLTVLYLLHGEPGH